MTIDPQQEVDGLHEVISLLVKNIAAIRFFVSRRDAMESCHAVAFVTRLEDLYRKVDAYADDERDIFCSGDLVELFGSRYTSLHKAVTLLVDQALHYPAQTRPGVFMLTFAAPRLDVFNVAPYLFDGIPLDERRVGITVDEEGMDFIVPYGQEFDDTLASLPDRLIVEYEMTCRRLSAILTKPVQWVELTPAKLRKLLGISQNTLNDRIESGEIPAERIHTKLLRVKQSYLDSLN